VLAFLVLILASTPATASAFGPTSKAPDKRAGEADEKPAAATSSAAATQPDGAEGSQAATGAAKDPGTQASTTEVSDSAAGSTDDFSTLTAKVQEIFDESCTMCHDSSGDPATPGGLNLEDASSLIGKNSVATKNPLVVPGDPEASYLVAKLVGGNIEGDLMPMGEDPLVADQIAVINRWIESVPPAAASAKTTDDGKGAAQATPKPFRGPFQNWLPTTAALGRRTLTVHISHRFGRIGTERGAFGLDAGVIMSLGLSYGILDGWDVLVRRSNSNKAWELGTKYIPVRQEDGMPVSFGGYASLDLMRGFDIANRVSGNFMVMLSRLWFQRWATMLTFSYHLRTNKAADVLIDFGDGNGPHPARDRRDSFVIGFATTVWINPIWAIDVEYTVPIQDGRTPSVFYWRGGDADPGAVNGPQVGAWTLGFSAYTGKHLFQVMLTNLREIHPNLAAPGGNSGNPFDTPGVDSKNPFHKANFFIGFNIIRKFVFKAPKGKRGKNTKAKQ
jgi:mono/diheme cytochrome c family protein